MSTSRRLEWVRVVLAGVGAAVVPILVLVGVLFVYGLTRQADSPSPAVFAPIAGAWVGPIGGFLATLAFAFWAASRSGESPLLRGLVVGVLAVVFDHIIGVLLGATFQPLWLLFYGGRVIAGLIGGWFGSTSMHLHRNVDVDCHPEILWRCLTDVEILKHWISQFVDETLDDPRHTGLGASSTIRMREGKRVVAYRSLVTTWEPERRLGIRLSGGSFAQGMDMDVLYVLSSGGSDRAILDYDVSVPLKGFLFKLMGPIIKLAAARNAKKDLSRLALLAPSVKPQSARKEMGEA
jgi:carbon monoxide dehydrogenase subunit G